MVSIIRSEWNRQIHGKGKQIRGCWEVGVWGKGGQERDYLIDTGVPGGRVILKLEKGGGYTAL